MENIAQTRSLLYQKDWNSERFRHFVYLKDTRLYFALSPSAHGRYDKLAANRIYRSLKDTRNLYKECITDELY